MSGSRRSRSIVGITTCSSEKQDKRLANRNLRHAVRLAVALGDDVMPVADDVSSICSMGKDGKRYFDPKQKPELMRK